MHTGILVRLVGLLALLVLLQGCISPANRLNELASQQGLARTKFVTAEFDLYGWRNYQAGRPLKTLNVYLEGDGKPWILRYWRAKDPTPYSALMMSLMASDSQPALYLGRPCYHGLARTRGCNVEKWTGSRYGPEIVAAMLEALQLEIRQTGAEHVQLFGHSGGGALAVLLAADIPQTRSVVTLAGNLNVASWTRLHGYTPLYGSVDPSRQPPLPAHIRQLHLQGGRDDNIPPILGADWISRQPNARAIEFPTFDHSCCWESVWPLVLSGLQQQGTDDAVSVITTKPRVSR